MLRLRPAASTRCCSRRSSFSDGEVATMSQPKDQIEQDAIAAEWGLALDDEAATRLAAAPTTGGTGPGVELAPAQWSGGGDETKFAHNPNKGGTERVLSQDEIDSLLGFSLSDVSLNDNSGIRAIIDSAMVSYERLPMLEIVFDRLVRLM